MKRKIIVITTVHRWNDVRVFEKEVKSLSKVYEVYYIAPADFESRSMDSINIIGIKKARNIYERLINMFSVLRLCLKIKAESIHFHDPELIFLGLFFKIFTKRIVIYDVHEDYGKAILSKKYIKKSFRGVISKIFSIFEIFATNKFFDKACVTTKLIKDKFDDKKSIIINNYPIDYSSRLSFKSVKGRFINVIVTGNMVKERGILTVLKSISILRDLDLKLHLLGEFKDIKFKNEIMDFIFENNMQDMVIISNSLPYQEMFIYLKEMDIGIVPYLPEPNHMVTLPNKLFEYMESGLAVLASDFPLYREVIENAACGLLFNSTDYEELAEKLLYMCTNIELLREYQSKAYNSFIKQYNWNAEEVKLLELYKELLVDDNI